MASELPPFDPQWLAAEQMMGGRMTMPAEPVDQSRARFDAIFKNLVPLLPPPTDAVETLDVTVPASGKRVRVYKPKLKFTNIDTASTNTSTLTLPVGLYIHSGGFFAGSIENEDYLCRDVAESSQIILYSADYRLAPEYPFPAGLNDVSAAYEFMAETASAHGGDASRKFIMGGSAGGSLTAAVGLKYATDVRLRASGLCIFVPATCDPSVLPEECKSRYTPELYADAPMIGNELVAKSREWYNAPPTDPLSSVLLHPNIKHLPPCYIAACTKDPTHQETLFFYEECMRQGVRADLVEWVGLPHFFWALPATVLGKSAEFMEVWSEKLRGMIADA